MRWRLPSGESTSLVLQTKAGMLEAVAQLAHDRRPERQKAMELVELEGRERRPTNTNDQIVVGEQS